MPDENSKKQGIVLNIQKLSVHDGPGIRTTVFFKGCPLSCLWCANPESQKKEPEIACAKNRCIQCGYCSEVCPEKIIGADRGYPITDRARCTLCLKCVEGCCTNAKKVIGQSYAPEALCEEILKDKAFYDSSGGGATFSGGEPFTQPDFLQETLSLCKRNGLHTAVETTGAADLARLLEALPLLDLIYYDLKHMSEEAHVKLTGTGNKKILENLAVISQKHPNIIVRIPVVPGLNDDPANIGETAAFAASLAIPVVELLPYHNLGKNKYEQLGRAYALPETKEPSEARMEFLSEEAQQAVGFGKTRIQVMKSM